MNISVIGLGKLGLCSAACFAAKGHKVTGVDSNLHAIEALNAGQCPIDEPGLAELFSVARPNMCCTSDYAEAVNNSDVTLIIVPTPSTADGSFDNSAVETVLKQLAPALREKQNFHIVDVVSTVMPGSCENEFRPLLDQMLQKTAGVDYGLVYNPEFIALGSVIRNFLNPDMVLIGASDSRSAETVRTLYASMVDSSPQYALMSLSNAEITKLALNCFVTMKISFANELAALCETFPGADVDVVSRALGADSRIGPKYLKGGLGFGGPCFPRDNQAFQRFAARLGRTAQLSPAVVAVNLSVVDRLEQLVRRHCPSGSCVALLGLSYKPDTHIVEQSQSIMLAERLVAAGYTVRLHDPRALPSVQPALSGQATLCEDPYTACTAADMILLLTDWPQFAELDWERIEREAGPTPVLLDSWRCLRERSFTRLRYVPLGLNTQSQNHAES